MWSVRETRGIPVHVYHVLVQMLGIVIAIFNAKNVKKEITKRRNFGYHRRGKYMSIELE